MKKQQTKRQRIKEHRERILKGLITTLENDLYGTGAAYIYEPQGVFTGDLSDKEIAEIRKAGDAILKQLSGLIHR